MFFVKSKCAFYVTQTCIKSRQIFDHMYLERHTIAQKQDNKVWSMFVHT